MNAKKHPTNQNPDPVAWFTNRYCGYIVLDAEAICGYAKDSHESYVGDEHDFTPISKVALQVKAEIGELRKERL
jgi:hypothetical protein